LGLCRVILAHGKEQFSRSAFTYKVFH
jgi:hypothetical protein